MATLQMACAVIQHFFDTRLHKIGTKFN